MDFRLYFTWPMQHFPQFFKFKLAMSLTKNLETVCNGDETPAAPYSFKIRTITRFESTQLPYEEPEKLNDQINDIALFLNNSREIYELAGA